MKSNARCPACGGAIHAIASRCKHCKAPLAPADAPAAVAAPPPLPAPVAAVVTTTRSAAAGWSGRWPLVVAAVALLAIGVSLGVLLEQWRQSTATSPREAIRSTTPRMVPDRMPAPELPARPEARP